MEPKQCEPISTPVLKKSNKETANAQSLQQLSSKSNIKFVVMNYALKRTFQISWFIHSYILI